MFFPQTANSSSIFSPWKWWYNPKGNVLFISQSNIQTKCKRTYKDNLSSGSSYLLQPTQSLCVWMCRKGLEVKYQKIHSLFHFTHFLNFWTPGVLLMTASCSGRQTFPVLFFPVLHGCSVCLNPLSKCHHPDSFSHIQSFSFPRSSLVMCFIVFYCLLAMDIPDPSLQFSERTT